MCVPLRSTLLATCIKLSQVLRFRVLYTSSGDKEWACCGITAWWLAMTMSCVIHLLFWQLQRCTHSQKEWHHLRNPSRAHRQFGWISWASWPSVGPWISAFNRAPLGHGGGTARGMGGTGTWRAPTLPAPHMLSHNGTHRYSSRLQS